MGNMKKEAICITTCPGGSNVSMISYKVAAALDKEGYCTFVRVAGEKARDKDTARLNEADKAAQKWILLEGCNKGCGLEALKIAGITPEEHILVTDLGIQRENKTDFTPEELATVLEAVKKTISPEK